MLHWRLEAGAVAAIASAWASAKRPAPPAQAVIRPWRLSKVVAELDKAGIRGMTVTECQGAGVQGGECPQGAAAAANRLAPRSPASPRACAAAAAWHVPRPPFP